MAVPPPRSRDAEGDDLALLARLRAGDEAAFEALVLRHHPLLVRTAAALIGSVALAEELAQESWMAALENLSQFEGKGSLAGWLVRIVANRARTAAVREGRGVGLAPDEGGAGPSVDGARFGHWGDWERPPRRWSDDTPERLLARTQTRAALAEAIGALPAMQRAVVTLRDVEGLSAAEVCAALELSEGNQRVLLHRGRSTLRQLLEGLSDGL